MFQLYRVPDWWYVKDKGYSGKFTPDLALSTLPCMYWSRVLGHLLQVVTWP
jgi:hypothetical protein